MRVLLTLLLVGGLAGSAWARPHGHHRHHRHRSLHHGHHGRYVSHFRYHFQRRNYYYGVRSQILRRRVFVPHHYGYGYRYGPRRTYGYDRYYGGCGSYYGGYAPYYDYLHARYHISAAPIATRMTTVLTLDDAVFDGKPAVPDFDGLPRARTGPVGARFLVSTDAKG